MKKKLLTILKDIGFLVGILTISTGIGILFEYLKLQETNVVVVYIFSILMISILTNGYVYGLIASGVSILLFNFFFTEPRYNFKVDDLTYIITFLIMISASIATSTLTSIIKKSAKDAQERQKESNALYQMTNLLTDVESEHEIADITISTINNVFKCNPGCVCFDLNGYPESTFAQRKEDGTIIRRELLNQEELHQRMETLHGAKDETETECLYPIYGKKLILAVLFMPKDTCSSMKDSQIRMLHSIIESSALAFERLRSAKEEAKSREETTQERYRANLLRAISHDIRTPLSGIMGTSEILIDKTKPSDTRYELAKNIYKDAQWLHGLVENILNLTKLRDGKLALNKEVEPIEEVIGATLNILEKRLPDRKIDVHMPDTLVMIPMDAKLISQVLMNLLDNANKFTDKNKQISISVETNEKDAIISVKDRGIGISKTDLPHIFKTFYTTELKNPDSKRGVGLGLAICQSIVEAHGGTIKAENRVDGGAIFTFTLPLKGE